MRIIDNPKISGQRVSPLSIWDQATANWMSDSLSDIYSEKSLLGQCYSTRRVQQKDEDEFPKIIYDYIESFNGVGQEDCPRNIFIIYAPPGLGKTTYLSHLFNYPERYSARLKKRLFPLICDIRNFSDLEKISECYYEWLYEQLYKNPVFGFSSLGLQEKQELYIKMFSENLSRQLFDFDERMSYKELSVSSDLYEKVKCVLEERYLGNKKMMCQKSIGYLSRYKNIRVILVIDNFDHYDEHDEAKMTHQKVYALAKEIKEAFISPVFLPMRNNTMKDSYDRNGYLEADNPRTKRLSALIHSSVLEKRVEYIVNNLGRRVYMVQDEKVLNKSGEDVVSSLGKVFGQIMEGREINAFLESISGTNIRSYLDLVRTALQSGHLYSDVSGGVPSLTFESFLRACSLCNNIAFNPGEERTQVINLFDNNNELSYSNALIRIRVLQYLNYASAPVKAKCVADELLCLGYRKESIYKALKVFLRHDLIEELPYQKSLVSGILDSSFFKITKTGKYYIEDLCFALPYVKIMYPAMNLPDEYFFDIKSCIQKELPTRRFLLRQYDLLKKINGYLSAAENEELGIMRRSNVINRNKYISINGIIESRIREYYFRMV